MGWIKCYGVDFNITLKNSFILKLVSFFFFVMLSKPQLSPSFLLWGGGGGGPKEK